MTEITVETSVETTIEEVKVVSPPKPDKPINIVEVKKKGPDPIPASRVLPDLDEEVKQAPSALSPPDPLFTPQSSMDMLTKPASSGHRKSARFDPHAEEVPDEEPVIDELKGV